MCSWSEEKNRTPLAQAILPLSANLQPNRKIHTLCKREPQHNSAVPKRSSELKVNCVELLERAKHGDDSFPEPRRQERESGASKAASRMMDLLIIEILMMASSLKYEQMRLRIYKPARCASGIMFIAFFFPPLLSNHQFRKEGRLMNHSSRVQAIIWDRLVGGFCGTCAHSQEAERQALIGSQLPFFQFPEAGTQDQDDPHSGWFSLFSYSVNSLSLHQLLLTQLGSS